MATELEAVNILLVARSVVPVLALDSGHPDVQAARLMLKQHKRSLNSLKWWYNVEKDVTLYYNTEGYIHVPATCIGLDEDQNYVIMDGKLYDPVERTNIFTENVEELTLIYDRDWPNLPIQAFDYIVANAKEEFIRPLESSILSGEASRDKQRCKAIFNMTDMRYKDVGKQAGNPLMVKWRQKMLVR